MENHFEFILKATGVVTSPNHPDNYPLKLNKTQTIEVESGKILRLEFTHFAVDPCDISDFSDILCNSATCRVSPDFFTDFVKITDGDGTTLMDNRCGFSDSDRDPSDSCLGRDYVKVTDGDGTTLMDKSCGASYSIDPSSPHYFLPPNITTSSNRVDIFFHTDDDDTAPGWSLSWSAVTPGEKALMLNSINKFHISPAIKTLISLLKHDWRAHQTS